MVNLKINVTLSKPDPTRKRGSAKWLDNLIEKGTFDPRDFYEAIQPFVLNKLTSGLSDFGYKLRNPHDPRLQGIPLVSDSWDIQTTVTPESLQCTIRNTQPRMMVDSLPRSGIKRGGFGKFTGKIGGGKEFFFWLRGNNPNFRGNIYPMGTVGHGYTGTKNLESKANLPPGTAISDIDSEAKAIAYYTGSGEKVIRAHVPPRGNPDKNVDTFKRILVGLVKKGIDDHVREAYR